MRWVSIELEGETPNSEVALVFEPIALPGRRYGMRWSFWPLASLDLAGSLEWFSSNLEEEFGIGGPLNDALPRAARGTCRRDPLAPTWACRHAGWAGQRPLSDLDPTHRQVAGDLGRIGRAPRCQSGPPRREAGRPPRDRVTAVPATIIDGKAIAADVRAQVARDVAAFTRAPRPRARPGDDPRRRGPGERRLRRRQAEGLGRGRASPASATTCRPTPRAPRSSR